MHKVLSVLCVAALMMVIRSSSSAAQGIAYDELILVGRCPFVNCRLSPEPGTFSRDWRTFEQWKHSQHSYWPGQSFHVEYSGTWARVDDPYEGIVSICNTATNDFIALAPSSRTFWRSSTGARGWFGSRGCSTRFDGAFLGATTKVDRDSASIPLRVETVDGIPASGIRIYRRYYQKPVKGFPLTEATLESVVYRAPFSEPCPGTRTLSTQQNFSFCGKGGTRFVLFLRASQSPVPGMPEAYVINGGTIVVERGHIRHAVNLADFTIPADYANACAAHHHSALTSYCQLDR